MHARLVVTAAKALALAVLLFTLVPASPSRAQGDLDISVFYEELEQHGRWFTHPRYGYVWSPDVDDDWRPYSRGHWIYTEDHGWYWEAEETWGWGPFHYGRWILDDDYGWVWIPGTEWGPAWVAWRYSDEYVGWAPLPPEAEWYEDRGLTFSASYYDGPQFAPLWIFVEPRYLVLPGLHRYALPRSRNIFALGRTRWHTDYRFVNRRVFNAGFDVRHFERITRRPVVRVRLTTGDSPRQRGFRDNDRRTLQVYRPRLVAGPNPPRPPRLTEPRRREWHRRDGDRPLVRPGFTPQDAEKRGRGDDDDARRKGAARGVGDDDDARRRGVRGPGDDDDARRKGAARGSGDDDDARRRGVRGSDDDDARRRGVRGPGDDDDARRRRDTDDGRRKEFGRPPQEDNLRRRPQGEASGGPPHDFRKQEFKQPPAGVQTPPGQSGGGDPRFRQRDNRQPEAGQQPGARPRVEGGPPGGQQSKQQGGAPPPQRDGGNGKGDAGKKGKEKDPKDGTVPR